MEILEAVNYYACYRAYTYFHVSYRHTFLPDIFRSAVNSGLKSTTAAQNIATSGVSKCTLCCWHLVGSGYINNIATRNYCCDTCRAGYQYYFRTSRKQLVYNSVSHFPGRLLRYIPYGINGFSGGSGGDEHLFPFEYILFTMISHFYTKTKHLLFAIAEIGLLNQHTQKCLTNLCTCIPPKVLCE